MQPTPLVAVLGAGSWGTALALLLARNGLAVRLWGHLDEEVAALRRDRENRTFLPGHRFPDNLAPGADLGAAIDGADEVLVVVPSHAFGALCQRIADSGIAVAALSWATKGFDPAHHELLSTVAARHLPGVPLAVLSGPTFALEVAQGLPTAITIAATSTAHGDRLGAYLHNERFRTYTSPDLAGVQVGGAAKNVMAIAAGISDGLGFGANARAAVITRGLSEITRLGLRLGGRPETFMGLAGLGDLTLTCTDDQSRNRRMGLALARGLSIAEARAQIAQEVEGVNTAREVYQLACQLDVDMPITEQTYRVLHQGLDPREATRILLNRELRSESVADSR